MYKKDGKVICWCNREEKEAVKVGIPFEMTSGKKIKLFGSITLADGYTDIQGDYYFCRECGKVEMFAL